jgi:glycosyltransferase involved in cell wall biosynthesis
MERFVRAEDVNVTLCIMRHLWSGAIFPSMRKAGSRVLLMLHDTTPHPGEEYPFWWQHLRWDLTHTDGLVVLSDHVRASVIRLFGYPPDRIWSAPLVVSPFHASAPCLRRLPKDRPVRILMFGRILPYKGIGLLADAFRLVSQRHQVELRIVGQGHDPALDDLADRPDVRVDARWIPEREITEILAQTDIVVTPYTEASQSGVIPMAYALGLPIVTTPVGGLVEQVEDGVTGILAKDLSAIALANALSKIITDPALYEHCSGGALSASRETLNGAAMATKLLEIARSLAALPPR